MGKECGAHPKGYLMAEIIEGHLTITHCYELAIAQFSSASVLPQRNSCQEGVERVLQSPIYLRSDSELVTLNQCNATIYMQDWNGKACRCQDMKEVHRVSLGGWGGFPLMRQNAAV